MIRSVLFHLAAIACVIFLIGCSTSSQNPTVPGHSDNLSTVSTNAANSQSTQLWGFWTVYIDIEKQEATPVLNRSAMFTANCVNFLNSKPLSLTFDIIETPVTPEYIDVDIDVSLTHPFPGLPQYNGYDVRGVFMGDGSNSLNYNSDLFYPVEGSDQLMLPDPDDGIGGPDGYTRWFNPSEFKGGMPLFSYTPGNMASPGYDASATLCPYKYFADGLGNDEPLWNYLGEHAVQNGAFSSGATNTRNYYLRFPTPAPNVKYNYAVIANWEGVEEQYHPSNAPEAIAVKVDDSGSTVYYVDGTDNGGEIVLDIDVWNWDASLSAGVMEDYTIFIDSTVLSSPYMANTSDMTPDGGTENYSTYHIDVPADAVEQLLDNEYWVIIESNTHDYSNIFDVPNDAWNDPLAAFFRYDLYVSPEGQGPCEVVIDPSSPEMPYEGWPILVTFDASGNTGATTFEWDFDNDGIFGDTYWSGTDAIPTVQFNFTNQEQVCVLIDGQDECCVDVDLIIHPSKNIPLRGTLKTFDIALDQINGRVLIIYNDGQVWQYLLDDWYAQPSPDGPIFDTEWDQYHDSGPGAFSRAFIDITDDQHAIVDYCWRPDPNRHTWRAWFDVIDEDGTFVTHKQPKGGWYYSYTTLEGIAFGENGTRANDVGSLWGTSVPGSFNYASMSFGSVDYLNLTYYMNWYTEATTRYGYQYFMGVWTMGAETDQDDSTFWNVERLDFYAAQWSLGTPGWDGDGIEYAGNHFGTGSQTEDDDGFNNPRDMTRTSDNEYIVLDKLVDESMRLKAFDVSVSPGVSIDGFDLEGLTGPVIKIDSGDWIDPVHGDYLLVMHGDDTEGYFLSLYLPYELPW